MALLKFLKGNYASLNNAAIAEGQVLICGDTREMFVDIDASTRIKIGDFITVANLDALPDASTVPASRLYYVEGGNILARSNGTEWIQINKQRTADEIKTLVGIANYELKTDAEAKLTEAKGYTDTEVGKVQGSVDALSGKVGEVPENKTVVQMISEAQAGATYDDTEVRRLISENTAAIGTEKSRAEGIEGGLRTDVDTIKGDYLKTADKEALQTQINTIMNNPDAEGAINSINEFTQYVADHGTIADGFRTDIDKNKDGVAANASAIALKANAADVYAKTETYTKTEVEALLTWGSF